MATEVEASSLDDFFAKKDKSKKKKTKILTEVNALSQPEEKPKKKKSKEKSSASSSEGGKTASGSSSATENRNKADDDLQQNPDEWVEIEEKADADYTGLKIQSLRLEEREAAAKEENAAGEDEETGKNGGAGSEGPWKKLEAAPVVEKDNTTEVVSESKESTPTGTGKYVPPSVRAAQRQAAQQSSAPMRKRNNKLAPDVNDQESFPTLGGGMGSGRRTPGLGDSNIEAPKSYTSLHLQNKWDSLSRGSSEP